MDENMISEEEMAKLAMEAKEKREIEERMHAKMNGGSSNLTQSEMRKFDEEIRRKEMDRFIEEARKKELEEMIKTDKIDENYTFSNEESSFKKN